MGFINCCACCCKGFPITKGNGYGATCRGDDPSILPTGRMDLTPSPISILDGLLTVCTTEAPIPPCLLSTFLMPRKNPPSGNLFTSDVNESSDPEGHAGMGVPGLRCGCGLVSVLLACGWRLGDGGEELLVPAWAKEGMGIEAAVAMGGLGDDAAMGNCT